MFISRRGTIDRDVKSSVFQHRPVYFPLYFLYVYYQNISKAIYSSVDISVVFKVSTIFVKRKKSKEFKIQNSHSDNWQGDPNKPRTSD